MTLKIQMKDLKNNQCRWPEGDIQAGITFCGEEVVKGNPYCECHKVISLKPKVIKVDK